MRISQAFARRAAFTAVIAGVVVQMAGFVVDAAIHERKPDLASHEDLFTLSNPGHALIFAGIALTIGGVVLALLLRAIDSDGAARYRRATLPVALIALAFAAGSFLATSTGGHLAPGDHAHVVDAATAELTSLSPEDAALVGTSRHEHASEIPVQARDLEKLASQLETVRNATARYVDLDAARTDGYVQITQDIPLIGAHFINPAYVADGVFDPAKPEMLIYTFKDNGWQLYGASFITKLTVTGDEPLPEGFAGPFDVWHYHDNWCFTLSGARVTTAAGCAQAKGFFVPRMGYMLHVWFKDNPNGVFAHSHPDLRGSDALILDPSGLLKLLALVLAR